MNKKEILKFVSFLAVFIALSIVIVRVFSFERTKDDVTIETPVIDNTNKDKSNNIEFTNDSSMTEEEVRNLVESKREILKDFFLQTKYYSASEVSKDFTSEEDNDYLVLDSKFFEGLQALVTEGVYNSYWDQFGAVNKRNDILVTEDLYIAKKGVFDDIYYESAIAINDVTEEKIVLKKATDEKIETYINIKYCPEEESCPRNELYHFDLIKNDSDWLIADFTTKRS